MDSRKRVAGSDSDFEVDLGESLHLQSDARLAVHSLSVAYDGNRLVLNDLELRQQFPDAADYPAAPPASLTKPFSVDHMLGPSFVSGGQQVFEFVRMMAHNEVYLRCAQLANTSRVLGNLGDDILSKITLKSGVGCIMETGSDDGHFMALRGPVTPRHMRFRLTDLQRRPASWSRPNAGGETAGQAPWEQEQTEAALSVEGVFQMAHILPERLLALVRPAFDLVLRRIRSLKRCVQACGCKIMTPRYACKMPSSCVSARRAKKTGKKKRAKPNQPESQPEAKPNQPESQPGAKPNQPESQPEAKPNQPESQPEAKPNQPESQGSHSQHTRN